MADPQTLTIVAWDVNFVPAASQGSQVSPSPLNDGDLLTWLRSPNGTNWWFLDFGGSVTLQSIELYEDGFRTGSSGVFAVDEPTDWTDFNEYSTNQIDSGWATPGSNTYTLHTIDTPGAYRYYAVRQSNRLQWADANFVGWTASAGTAAAATLHGDQLFRWIQENYAGSFTSLELVGALNELNGTNGVEYAQARGTFLGVDPAG